MIEYKIASDESGARDKLDMVFRQLREKAAAHRKWNSNYVKQDDGSAKLEIVFEAPETEKAA